MAQARQCLCFIGSARRPRERRVATTSGLGARATALFASQRAWVRDARASDTRNRRRKRASRWGRRPCTRIRSSPWTRSRRAAWCSPPRRGPRWTPRSRSRRGSSACRRSCCGASSRRRAAGTTTSPERTTGRRGWTERSSSTRGTSFTTASTARSGWIWSRWTASWASCAG